MTSQKHKYNFKVCFSPDPNKQKCNKPDKNSATPEDQTVKQKCSNNIIKTLSWVSASKEATSKVLRYTQDAVEKAVDVIFSFPPTNDSSSQDTYEDRRVRFSQQNSELKLSESCQEECPENISSSPDQNKQQENYYLDELESEEERSGDYENELVSYNPSDSESSQIYNPSDKESVQSICEEIICEDCIDTPNKNTNIKQVPDDPDQNIEQKRNDHEYENQSSGDDFLCSEKGNVDETGPEKTYCEYETDFEYGQTINEEESKANVPGDDSTPEQVKPSFLQFNFTKNCVPIPKIRLRITRSPSPDNRKQYEGQKDPKVTRSPSPHNTRQYSKQQESKESLRITRSQSPGNKKPYESQTDPKATRSPSSEYKRQYSKQQESKEPQHNDTLNQPHPFKEAYTNWSNRSLEQTQTFYSKRERVSKHPTSRKVDLLENKLAGGDIILSTKSQSAKSYDAKFPSNNIRYDTNRPIYRYFQSNQVSGNRPEPMAGSYREARIKSNAMEKSISTSEKSSKYDDRSHRSSGKSSVYSATNGNTPLSKWGIERLEKKRTAFLNEAHQIQHAGTSFAENSLKRLSRATKSLCSLYDNKTTSSLDIEEKTVRQCENRWAQHEQKQRRSRPPLKKTVAQRDLVPSKQRRLRTSSPSPQSREGITPGHKAAIYNDAASVASSRSGRAESVKSANRTVAVSKSIESSQYDYINIYRTRSSGHAIGDKRSSRYNFSEIESLGSQNDNNSDKRTFSCGRLGAQNTPIHLSTSQSILSRCTCNQKECPVGCLERKDRREDFLSNVSGSFNTQNTYFGKEIISRANALSEKGQSNEDCYARKEACRRSCSNNRFTDPVIKYQHCILEENKKEQSRQVQNESPDQLFCCKCFKNNNDDVNRNQERKPSQPRPPKVYPRKLIKSNSALTNM